MATRSDPHAQRDGLAAAPSTTPGPRGGRLELPLARCLARAAAGLVLVSLACREIERAAPSRPTSTPPRPRDAPAAHPALAAVEEEEPDAMLGYSLAVLDDVDGLGRRDFAVSAPIWSRDESLLHEGAVLLFSTERRKPLRRLDRAGESFRYGARLALVGDLDGDGKRELMVGMDKVYEDEIGSTDLISTVDGRVVHRIALPSYRIAPLQDLDGDGRGDLALAYPCEGWRRARLELVSGKDLHGLGRIELDVCEPRLEPLPDLDGDGRADCLVIERGGPPGVRLLMGLPAARSVDLTPHFVQGWDPRRDWHVAAGGDRDGDGVSELWVARGELETSSRLECLLLRPEDGCVWRAEGASDWDEPWCPTALPDLDRDGIPDYVLSELSPFSVSVVAHSGADGHELWGCAACQGATEGNWPARELALLDDEDGDGVPELLVGAGDYGWSHGNLARDDRLYILSGRDGRRLWRIGLEEVAELAWQQR